MMGTCEEYEYLTGNSTESPVSCNANFLITDSEVKLEINQKNNCDVETAFITPNKLRDRNSMESSNLYNIVSPAAFSDIIKNAVQDSFDYAETIDITPEKFGGVLKKVIKEGEENDNPGFGDRVSIHYTGWLFMKEPRIFETSLKGEHCEFNLGRGMVIKGWDLGISTMKKGEIALFICHPNYGYGSVGYLPTIPPDTPLLFKVELIDWKLEDLSPKKDNSIFRRVIEKGIGNTLPNDGSNMEVKIIKYEGKDIVAEDVKEFILGEGCNSGVPEGLEIALQKFHLKEKAEIYLKKNYVSHYGELSNTVEPELKYEVTLLNFSKAKEIWEMNSDEKLEKAKLAKVKGILFFQDGNYRIALKQFKSIVTCLDNEPGVSSDSKDSRITLLLSAYLNISLCYLKMEDFIEVIKFCNKALLIDEKNEKALFRRGQAKLQINDFDEALLDFNLLINLKPNNKAAQNLLTLCQDKAKKQKLKDKATYNKMFDRFLKQDQERLKNMKTETGVWECDDEDQDDSLCKTDHLISVEKLISDIERIYCNRE